MKTSCIRLFVFLALGMVGLALATPVHAARRSTTSSAGSTVVVECKPVVSPF